MKAERRHELQQNVLDAELAQSIKFFRKHGSKILLAVLAVTLIICVTVFAITKRREAISARWMDYQALKLRMEADKDADPDQLLSEMQVLSTQTDNKKVAALATITLGDQYSLRYLCSPVDSAERKEFMQKAQDAYQAVLTNYKDNTPVVSRAHLGLASLAGSNGNWEKMKDHYRAVEQIGADAAPFAVELARAALQRDEGYQKVVKLATTRPAEPKKEDKPEAPAEETK